MAAGTYCYLLSFLGILLFLVICFLALYIHRLLKYRRQQNDYYEYLDSLFVMVAHDIKSPIIALKEATAIIKLRLKNNDVKDAINFIEKFDNTIRKIEHTAYKVLSVGKKTDFREKPCDVIDVMESIVSFFSNTHLEIDKVNVQYVINSDNIIINHPEGMEIIIRNWIMNAVKHSHAHMVQINISQNSRGVIFVIQDDGQIIDNGIIKSIKAAISNVEENEYKQQKKFGLFLIGTFLRFTKSTATIAIIHGKNTFTITTNEHSF